MKHTPGPWIQDREYVFEKNAPGRCVCTGHEYTVRGPVTFENWEANARLIAAAPDLWAKGMAADTCLSLAFSYARELGKHDEAKHFFEVQRGLRAALAKTSAPSVIGR